MKIKYGKGKAIYGPGVIIEMSGAEIAIAISAYMVARGVHISGPRTITVNSGCRIDSGHVYVDPEGYVVAKGKKISGRGALQKRGVTIQ